MISKQELMQARAEWQLDIGVIEKDYVLGWVLAARSRSTIGQQKVDQVRA